MATPSRSDRTELKRARMGMFPVHGDHSSETKPFYLTSEFLVFALYMMGLGIAAGTDSTIDARFFWIFATVAVAFSVDFFTGAGGTTLPYPNQPSSQVALVLGRATSLRIRSCTIALLRSGGPRTARRTR